MTDIIFSFHGRDLFGPFTGHTNASDFDGIDPTNSGLSSFYQYVKFDPSYQNRNSSTVPSRNKSAEIQASKPVSAIKNSRANIVKTSSERERTVVTPQRPKPRSDFVLVEKARDASTQSERNSDTLVNSSNNQLELENQPPPKIMVNNSEISPENYFRRGSNAINMLMVRFKQNPKEMYMHQNDLSSILSGYQTVNNTPKEESIILPSKDEENQKNPFTSHQIQHNLGSLDDAQKNISKWAQKIEIHKSGLQQLVVDPKVERKKKLKRRYRRKLKELTNEVLVRKESLFGKRFQEYCDKSNGDFNHSSLMHLLSRKKSQTHMYLQPKRKIENPNFDFLPLK